MKLFLCCGRLNGWDNDIASVITAADSEAAQRAFTHAMFENVGQLDSDREYYIHQCDEVGEYISNGTLKLLEGYKLT
jgi:hypothetical protein